MPSWCVLSLEAALEASGARGSGAPEVTQPGISLEMQRRV